MSKLTDKILRKAHDKLSVHLYGEPSHGSSRAAIPEPNSISEYQRHLIEEHDYDEGDDILEAWCSFCGERIESLGQQCQMDEGPCEPDVRDLEALHADTHDDERMDSSERHVHV